MLVKTPLIQVDECIVDPVTGRLLVDSQSREYRRYRRREWLQAQRRMGWKRIDLWLSPTSFVHLLAAMKTNESYGACIERLLEELPE